MMISISLIVMLMIFSITWSYLTSWVKVSIFLFMILLFEFSLIIIQVLMISLARTHVRSMNIMLLISRVFIDLMSVFIQWLTWSWRIKLFLYQRSTIRDHKMSLSLLFFSSWTLELHERILQDILKASFIRKRRKKNSTLNIQCHHVLMSYTEFLARDVIKVSVAVTICMIQHLDRFNCSLTI